MKMTCKELVELVTDYLDGKLQAVDLARFEEHIATCDGCTAYLDQMRRTIRVMSYLHEDALPSQQWQDLLEIFRNWKNN